MSGSHLRVVTRPIPWPPLKETLDLLIDGPTAAERARGIGSELQPVYTPTKVTAGQAKVRISLPPPKPMAMPQGTRSILWIGQLTCTAASALAARTDIDPDAITVVITQSGARSIGSFRCSQFPRGSE